MIKLVLVASILALFSCNSSSKSQGAEKTIGSIERLDPSLDMIVDNNAKPEILAKGYEWTEGPVWVESEKMLLYSDIPPNKVFKWTEAKGAEVYLNPSGYTGPIKRSGEVGSNGLLVNKDGKLILCQHGDRRIALMDAPLQSPQPKFTSIADTYQGKKFNSPNDIVLRSNGDLFFTDPPYGLEKNAEDPSKEIPFQGVYKVSGGKVTLLIDSITRPNGIAITRDEKSLIIANSDDAKPYWYMYDFGPNDSLTNARIFFDGKKAGNGGGDGMKIDREGNVFATGPGGVLILNKDGKLLGRIRIPEACSNVALADDDKTLFITADMYLLRVKLRS